MARTVGERDERAELDARDPEFGSEGYFRKLSEQQQTQQPPSQANATSSTSSFPIPFRDSPLVDIKPPEKKEKGRFSGLRNKVPRLHSFRPAVPSSKTPVPRLSSSSTSFKTRTRPSLESVQEKLPPGGLFFCLPNELQMQIICSLPFADILTLRLSSRLWHTFMAQNEYSIARHFLDHHFPAYAVRLYPVPEGEEPNLHHVCALWHRLHVAAKLAYLMCEWITKDIFLRVTPQQKMIFAPQNERMRRRLIPLLFTIFHFFETYRKLHLKHLTEHGGRGLQREPYTQNPIEAEIMAQYDDKTLLRVHEVFPLVISSFCRRLRPPTYAGRVERTMRGYSREKPSDDVHVAILCIGGLRQIERLWEIKGYGSRRVAVDNWYNGLTREQQPPVESTTKSRRGLMGFGRKKSTNGEVPKVAGDGLSRVRSSSMDEGVSNGGQVFNNSMTTGPPMPPLSRQEAQYILGDLPVLQQIWATSAEAILHKRAVVKQPSDIHRNQQVMLDLISEDSISEEDEWWYGRNIPDSVRPPAGGVTDDDAD